MSEPWDIEEKDILTSPPTIHGGVSPFIDLDSSSSDMSPTPTRVSRSLSKSSQNSVKPKSRSSVRTATSDTPVKSASGTAARRKTMGEQIADALSASRDAQIASSQARVDARLAIEDKKADSMIQLERMWMQFQVDQELRLQMDREAARRHDTVMMDKQIELERLKRGFAQSAIDPSLSTL